MTRVTLAPTPLYHVCRSEDVDLLALDEALGKLGKLDPQQSRIVELRYFAGFSVEDTAQFLG